MHFHMHDAYFQLNTLIGMFGALTSSAELEYVKLWRTGSKEKILVKR